MPSRADIDDFLSQERIAVIGVSRHPDEFANVVYRELRGRGYDLYPVNPNSDLVEGDPCYPGVQALPEPVDGALVMVDAQAAQQVVKECHAAGIRRVWLHRGAGGCGAVSDEAVRYCLEHGIRVIDGECPMMFAEPVRSFHRAHRFARRLTGRLPS